MAGFNLKAKIFLIKVGGVIDNFILMSDIFIGARM